MIIYKITNTINGKIYIGKSTTNVDTRWELHLKHAFVERRRTRFCNALRKYGSNAFIREILVNDISTTEQLNEQEVHYIDQTNSTNPNIGYNMSKGGDGGFTEEMRRKSAEVRKQRGISLEHIQALAEGRRRVGYKPLSDEQKQQRSKRMKQYYQDHPEHHEHISKINKEKAKRGQEHPMWGKKHTPEARQKISEARQGKTYEEIFGKVRATERREQLKQQTASKNPNYANIDCKMLELLVETPKITRKAMCSLLACSGPTLTKRFKSLLGVNNLQHFRYGKTDQELKLFFMEKLNDFLHS